MKLLTNKLTALIISFIIAITVITFLFREQQDFGNLALGEETIACFAKSQNRTIHISSLDSLSHIVKGWKLRGEKEVIFCLGNSQTHGMNQMKQGDQNYIQLLSDTLETQPYFVSGISMPNISLQEMVVNFDYVQTHLAIKYLLVPVFMDDLREDGIRTDGSFKQLSNYQIKDSSEYIIQKINKELASQNVVQANNNDMAGLRQTTQEKVENYLTSKLEHHSSTWKNRPQVRGNFFNFLYIARNTLLGISAQTKRNMIPKRYKDNIDALKYILKTCASKKIKVLAYIPPIRDDVEVPYNLQEYDAFKKEIESETKKYTNVRFANFEKNVPGKYWGVKNSTNLGGKPELHFMHFQYEGHKILFSNLYEQLKLMMAK